MSKIKPKGYWTKSRVMESAKQHSTLSEWKKSGGGAIHAAIINDWYIEATAHMIKISGSLPKKWSKDKVLEDAKKYQSKSEWRKASNAYDMAHRKGWLEEACSHMITLWQAKWDKSKVLADAQKYNSRSEWEKLSSGAYDAANRNGWYDEATIHMPMLIETWTKEKILEDAKKYRTRGEWFNNSSSYSRAHSNGWLEEASSHMIKTYSFGELIIYTYLLEHDIEFIHQKRFADLKHINTLPFDFYLPRFHLLIEYNGIQHKRGWQGNKKNAEDIQHRDALKIEYATQNQIRLLIIDANKQEDIIKDIIASLNEISIEIGITFNPIARNLTDIELNNIANLGKWTQETVFASAKKFQTISEWKRLEGVAYNKAIKMGWKDEATAHMTRLIHPPGYWTKDRVIDSAKKFNTQIAWKKAHGGAWRKAVEMKWITLATAHMRQEKNS